MLHMGALFYCLEHFDNDDVLDFVVHIGHIFPCEHFLGIQCYLVKDGNKSNLCHIV